MADVIAGRGLVAMVMLHDLRQPERTHADAGDADAVAVDFFLSRQQRVPANDGGNMNFAPTFPIFDVMFGTFYMPKDRLPLQFGILNLNF